VGFDVAFDGCFDGFAGYFGHFLNSWCRAPAGLPIARYMM